MRSMVNRVPRAARSARRSRSGFLARSVSLAVAFAIQPVVRGEEPPAPADPRFFTTRVLPILETRCFECHSHSGMIEAGLALDSRSGWEQGGDSGPAVVPGNPAESLLLRAVRHADAVPAMPPTGRLPAEEIETLVAWVTAGATDPRDPAAGTAPAPGRPAIDIAAGRSHWAFQPVADPVPPGVADEAWPLDDIDRFILARLEAEGVRPVADAARHTWLRRVSFDLTGLPPSPAEIAAFVADGAPDAHSRVVDRLLASRAFGERWGRQWLDLTGYADQMGTSNDVFAEHAWRYRDWVIDAFNADKPYDAFVREQIAGDLLPASGPEERAARITATGFLVLGDVEIVAVDKHKLDLDLVDQQVTKVGTAFLGMTLGCVRCHDHKFDPIASEDYYGIAGTFRSTRSVHKIPVGVWSKVNEVELPESERQRAARLLRGEEHAARLAALKQDRERLEDRRRTLGKRIERAAAREAARVAAGATAEDEAGDDKDSAFLTKEQERLAREIRRLDEAIVHAGFFAPAPPRACAVRDAESPADMPIHVRGNPRAPGAVVPRGVLRVACWTDPPAMPAAASGRRELAEWIAAPQNPLTPRVAVNRIWQRLFGAGIVRSVDYFGTRGDLPTHPELLDRLAGDFVRDGWSVKRLVRRLALSHTYRLSSAPDATAAAHDPDDRLLWRMPRRRLDAESIRDAVLAVSGRLVDSDGGPALPLEMPENAGGLTDMVNPPSFRFRRFRPDQEFVRTVYLPVIRSAPQPGPARLREVFDFTLPATFAGMRSQTVVPTQALFLLNDPSMKARAADLARLVTTGNPDRAARLEALWLRCLGRPISAAEAADATAFLDAVLLDAVTAATAPGEPAAARDPAERSATDGAAWAELCHALLASNEFLITL
jgi:hypothetical protein